MKENKMAVTSINKLLLSMSAPAIFSMSVQALYNIVDSIFVSRVSEEALTAVSMAFPIQMIIIAVCVGMGVGINSLIARNLGENNFKEAKRIASHGIYIFVFLSLIIAVSGFFLSQYFFSLFTDIPSLVEKGAIYIQIILTFSFGRLMAQSVMSFLQGTGDMLHPMKSQLIGALSNIILDPIMIFGYFGFPPLGLKGAAIATVTAQTLSMVYLFIIFIKKNHYIQINLKDFRFHIRYIKLIFITGYPVSIMQGLMSFMLMGMNWILSLYGELAITAMGIFFKIQSFIFLPIIGLGQGALPIISFNYGAKSFHRMKQTVRYSLIFSLTYMFAGSLLFILYPELPISLFNPSKELMTLTVNCFQITGFSFPFAGFSLIFSTYFMGVGKTFYSMILSFIRMIVLLIPLAYLFGELWGLNRLWFSFPVCEALSFIIYYSVYTRLNRTIFKTTQ